MVWAMVLSSLLFPSPLLIVQPRAPIPLPSFFFGGLWGVHYPEADLGSTENGGPFAQVESLQT